MGRHIQRTLLSNASATGPAEPWPGGRGAFMAHGTFGGATVSLQFKSPAGTWFGIDSTNLALSAAGLRMFDCPPGEIRANVSGGTPSALYAYAVTADAV